MKKKILSVLIICTMLLNFTACGNSGNDTSNSEDITEITFWSHQNPSWNESYEKIIEQFEKENPDIKVNYENFPYDDYEAKVQTSLIEGATGADVYELWGGWAIDFAPNGALSEIPEDLANSIIEDCYEPTIGALLVDGKLYGLPLEFNIENGAMIVNKKIMEEKNIALPNTWDELVQAGIDGTEMDGNTFVIKGFDFVNWDSVPYLFTSMILSQGGQYLNEDGHSVDFDTPEAKKAFEELASLVVDKKVTDLEGLTGGGELEGYQSLFADRVMMVPRGPWTISEGTSTFELTYGEDFDYVRLPWYSDQQKFAAETGWALGINAKSDKQEASMKFLKYIYQDDVLLEHNIASTQIPPKKSVAHDESLIESMPFAEVLVSILEDAQYIGYFNSDIFKENINLVFTKYCNGEYSSVDDAMTELNTLLEDL